MQKFRVCGGPLDGGEIAASWVQTRLKVSEEGTIIRVPLERRAYRCPVEDRATAVWQFVPSEKDCEYIARYQLDGDRLVHVGRKAA